MHDDTPVYYSPAYRGLIALIMPDGLTQYGRETAAQVLAKHPDAFRTTLADACARADDAFRTGPREITREAYWESLECLPPEQWINWGESESFKCSERTAGTITAIYCRLGRGDAARYFVLQDYCRMPHPDVVNRCRAVAGVPLEVLADIARAGAGVGL